MDQVKHARDLDLALAKDLDRVRANNRPLDSTLASTLANTLDRASTLDRTLDRASALALARAVDLSLDLTTALTKMSFITIELARVRNHPYRIDFIVFTQLFVRLSRSLEHFVLLYNMLVSDTLPIHTWKRHSSPSITQEPKNLDLCNEIMRRLDQLERRRRGQEVVFEGLIIVKERKDVSANTDEKR